MDKKHIIAMIVGFLIMGGTIPLIIAMGATVPAGAGFMAFIKPIHVILAVLGTAIYFWGASKL
jgi:hypothetical protein